MNSMSETVDSEDAARVGLTESTATIVAGGSVVDSPVTVSSAGKPPTTTLFDRVTQVFALLLVTVALALAVAGIVFGTTHTLDWKKAAIPLALAALAAVGFVAKIVRG